MPLYEYECDTHGRFDEMRPFARSSEPAPCPDCGAESTRCISIPRLSGLDRSTRIAHETNERSSHEPHVCSSGCGHNHTVKKSAAKTAAAKPAGPPAFEQYKGPRPWVMEHA